MRSFPVFIDLDAQPVILIGEGEAADAKRRLYERAGAIIVNEFHPCAKIAVIAEEEDAPALEAATRCKLRGLLVNVVDRPGLCDFTTPAIVDRNPVTLAIGTGGASAGLAKALRQRLELMLPDNLGNLANALFAARPAIKARWPEARARRQAIDAALQPGGVLDPFTDRPDHVFDLWLASDGDTRQRGTQYIALSGGDPDDLTLKQARWLASADYVLTVGDVAPAILARVRADAQVMAEHAAPDNLPHHALVICLKAPAA